MRFFSEWRFAKYALNLVKTFGQKMSEKNFYRIMLGKNHSFAEECISGNFIGADWFRNEDLTNKFPEKWKDFNAVYIPKYLHENPKKSKVAAGISMRNVTYHL